MSDIQIPEWLDKLQEKVAKPKLYDSPEDFSLPAYKPPPPDLFNALAHLSQSVEFDRKKCVLTYIYPSVEYYNANIKPLMLARMTEPYLYFVNYFGEVRLSISIHSLLKHRFDSPHSTHGVIISYPNPHFDTGGYIYYEKQDEKQKEKRLQEEH